MFLAVVYRLNIHDDEGFDGKIGTWLLWPK